VLVLAFGGTLALLIALQRQGLPISDDGGTGCWPPTAPRCCCSGCCCSRSAGLYWASTMLINAPMRAPRLAWGNFGMMVAGHRDGPVGDADGARPR
jgi:hypothetical protein